MTCFTALALAAPAPNTDNMAGLTTAFHDLITSSDVKLEACDAFPADLTGTLQKRGARPATLRYIP